MRESGHVIMLSSVPLRGHFMCTIKQINVDAMTLQARQINKYVQSKINKKRAAHLGKPSKQTFVISGSGAANEFIQKVRISLLT